MSILSREGRHFWRKAYALVSGIIIGYIIITIYEVFYKPSSERLSELVIECLLAPRYTRSIDMHEEKWLPAGRRFAEKSVVEVSEMKINAYAAPKTMQNATKYRLKLFKGTSLSSLLINSIILLQSYKHQHHRLALK